MSDPSFETLASMTAGDGDIHAALAHLARNVAAVMADPQSRSADQRPVTMGRRMAEVVVVNAGPPLTADVLLNGETIPGASPQATYRPFVGDLVWLEFLGTDAHISPPLTTEANHGWTSLTLGGGWVQYLPGTPPGYMRDIAGWVHLHGAVAGGANGSTVGILPAGFRTPLTFSGHAVYCFSGGGPVNSALAIASTGEIIYYGPDAPTAVALDGVHFRID